MYCSRCGQPLDENARFCRSCGLDLTANTSVKRVSTQPIDGKSETDLVAEALVADYEVLGEVGRGGMAIVFRARDKQLDRDVAVKVLPFSLAFDAEFVERFMREARTAARLEHPNIIPIYRVNRAGRVNYFVMKLLRGQSLSHILSARGKLIPMEIRHLLAQTAGALGFAHRHGVVHRDVKPDNIMFDDELGHWVLMDFGIAKAASGTRLTGTGMSIGTPHYMSPEQARAQPLDGRSDVYSLGVVAYQCLTGRVPFDAEDAFSIGYKHIMEPLPEPPLDTAEARRLFTVIRRMLEKKADDRYQSADDLVRDLEGGRPSVTLLEMDPGAGQTLALTREEIAQVAATGREPAAASPLPPPSRARPSSPSVQRAGRPSASGMQPGTPVTPLPRRPAMRSPRPVRRKRGSGALVALVILAMGAGGTGGYFVYTRVLHPPGGDAVAPPPAVVELAVVTKPPVDAALLTARDSAWQVEEERLRALPDSGNVLLTGVPAGARIFVDTDPTGHRDTALRLDMGTHKVRVKAAGYEDFDLSVNVPKAETVAYPVAMSRAAAPVRPQPRPQPPAPAGQCTDPRRLDTYNLGNLCWDHPPSVIGDLVIPVPAGQVGSNRPVTILAHVGADGRLITASPVLSDLADPRFTRIAVRYVRERVRFEPARKAGRPVESFFRFRFAPQVRR